MAVTDEIIELGKKAVAERNNNNFVGFEKYAEQGYSLIEQTSVDTIQDIGYRYIKMILKGYLGNQSFDLVKKWLDRLIKFNNEVHFSDEEVGFYSGVYHFETGNLEEAYKQWREVVRHSGNNHFRYFEGEDKKYVEFYKKQTKLQESK